LAVIGSRWLSFEVIGYHWRPLAAAIESHWLPMKTNPVLEDVGSLWKPFCELSDTIGGHPAIDWQQF
jgi:hypothetical protein